MMVGVTAVAAFVAVGCGDKDESKDTGSSKEKPAATKVAEKAGRDSQDSPSFFGGSDSPLGRLFAATTANEGTKPQSSAKPTKEDERFARQICVAGIKFVDKLEKLSEKLDQAGAGSDSSDDMEDFGAALELMFEGIMDPLADFLDDFAKADPPKDMAGWHKEAAKVMKEMAKALRDGDFEALESFDESAIPEPPAEASARIEAAVAEVKECQELEKRSNETGDIFGG